MSISFKQLVAVKYKVLIRIAINDPLLDFVIAKRIKFDSFIL